jgi:NAD(P)-dependent dehydrogenase (short-subunit alcohol dehydrogenase family)
VGERTLPPQRQSQPGRETEMAPRPESDSDPGGCRRLSGRRAIVTGGDSGIGRAVAVRFAREGADVAVVYLEEHEDARETARVVEEAGRRCVLIAGDVGDAAFCREAVRRCVEELGGVDVLVNNAAEQHLRDDLADIGPDQLERTFRTNIFSMFFMAQAALPHMGDGAAIVNSASVTAYHGNPALVDYSSTKGAIVAFTRSLSQQVVDRGIRVNAVAPGPVWTPLIPATMPSEAVETFGSNVPMGRPAQPEEIAGSYAFLASDDAAFMTGQVLHPNGGTVVNG